MGGDGARSKDLQTQFSSVFFYAPVMIVRGH